MNFIVKKLIEWKGTKIMGNILAKVDGFKTYIAGTLGILVAVTGHFWGPIHVGPIDVPAIETAVMWRTIWEALTLMFLRAGVKKAEVAPTK